MKATISKSQYIRGLQCPKSLWYYRYRKDLAPEIDLATQARFDAGHQSGELAKRYFGYGVEVDAPYWEVDNAINVTRQLINDGAGIIFEATAKNPINGCYSRIDILQKVSEINAWNLIEVKSSTDLKDYHINDLSFQYNVFKSAGYEIAKCFIMVIDNSYVRNGEIDPKALFRLLDITDKVLAKQDELENIVEKLTIVLAKDEEPDITIGARCFEPYECDYSPHCWRHVPEYSVYDVFQMKKAEEIAKQYGVELEQLPENIRPSGQKAIDLESYLSGQISLNTDKIRNFLQKLEYPLYFLDYETINPAIPLFNGTRPYQQIPFQLSIHVENDPGQELLHYEYIHKERSDPRLPLLESLIEHCGVNGSIVVYNKSFEVTCNNELAEYFPSFTIAIKSINNRIVDLIDPFRSRWIYHPNQRSSYSIKNVLPAFTEVSYQDMSISDGNTASLLYLDFLCGVINEEGLSNLWKNLGDYCKLDTYGMKLLIDVLHDSVHY